MTNLKEFKEIAGALDIWLGSLYAVVSDLHKEALKSKSLKLDADTKKAVAVSLDSMISACAELRKDIEDQKESLSLLRRSPPGYGSAIIHFLYNIAIDPSSPSHKAQYFDKLKKLDKSINKQYVSISSALGVPEFSIEKTIREDIHNALSNWSNESLLRPELNQIRLEEALTSKTKYMVEAMLNANALKTELQDVIDTLTGSFSRRDAISPQFFKLIDTLKTRLLDITKDDYRVNLEKGFKNITELASSMIGRSTTASVIKMAQDASPPVPTKTLSATLANYKNKLKKYVDQVDQDYFPKQMEAILGTLNSEKPSSTTSLTNIPKGGETDIAHTYFQYIKELFNNQGRNNISSYLRQINTNLSDLQKILEEKSLPGPQESPTKKSPDELGKPIMEDKPINSTTSPSSELLTAKIHKLRSDFKRQ